MNEAKFVILLFTGIIIPSTSFPDIYYFVRENKTWDEAQAYCMSQFTALAHINNMENLTTMINTSWGYTGKAWIGLHTAFQWTWVDEEVLTNARWIPGHPGTLNDDMCVTFAGGFWTDVSCSQTKSSICFDGTNYMIVGSKMTWTNAEANCKSHGSSLAKVADDATAFNVMIKMAISFIFEAWIGLRTTTFWQWPDTKENDTFSNWQQGQPDDLNGVQNCAAVMVTNGTWTDEQCDVQYPFFCYDAFKSRTTVVRLTIRSTSNLEAPTSSDNLLQQLQMTFANLSVTDIKLSWHQLPVRQIEERQSTGDAC